MRSKKFFKGTGFVKEFDTFLSTLTPEIQAYLKKCVDIKGKEGKDY